MKKIIFVLSILICSLSFAQEKKFEKPDYKKIEKNIKKENTNLHYKTLMSRYIKADSTMTLEEKRHLYYGYTFDKNYSPYSHSDYTDSLRVVIEKDSLSNDDWKKVENFTNKMLEENPFDLRAINFQLYALEQSKNLEGFTNRFTQLKIIIDALASSGNGVSKESAYYVINTSHEYDLINILGFQFGGSQSLVEHYDYLTLQENDAKLKGFYFDVTPCLNSLSKTFKD